MRLAGLLLAAASAAGAPQAGATTLPEAVQKALARNPEVRAALATARAVAQEREQARAGYLPSLDVRIGEGREASSSDALRAAGRADRTLNRTERSLSLRQNLFDGGATRGEVERQASRIEQAVQRSGETAERLALRTADAYLNFLQEQAIVRFAEENVERHGSLLEMARLRMRSGVGNLADVEQAAARDALARSLLAGRQAALQEAAARYERAVGERPQDLAPPPPLPGSLPDTLEGLREAAIARSPRLKAAQAELEAARALRRAATSPYLPRLDLELGANWNRNIDGIPGPQTDQSAMLVLRYNLFRGFGDAARERELVQREAAALAALDDVRQEIVEQVTLAWDSLQATRRSLAEREAHERSTGRVLDAYREQFTLGRRSLLDLLNVQNELFQARGLALETRYAALYGDIRLRALAGTLVADLGLNYPAPEEAPQPEKDVPPAEPLQY